MTLKVKNATSDDIHIKSQSGWDDQVLIFDGKVVKEKTEDGEYTVQQPCTVRPGSSVKVSVSYGDEITDSDQAGMEIWGKGGSYRVSVEGEDIDNDSSDNPSIHYTVTHGKGVTTVTFADGKPK